MKPRKSFGSELNLNSVSLGRSAFDPRLVVSLLLVKRSKSHKRHELSNQCLMP